MEYQLTLATPENRPVVYELWIYDDVITENGAIQLGSKEVRLKIQIPSNSSADITKYISIEDWRAGKAVVIGLKNFQPGDIELIDSGNINLFLRKDIHIMLSSSEYTGTVPNITVSNEVINNINIQSKGSIRIDSIVDGVLKLWQ